MLTFKTVEGTEEYILIDGLQYNVEGYVLVDGSDIQFPLKGRGMYPAKPLKCVQVQNDYVGTIHHSNGVEISQEQINRTLETFRTVLSGGQIEWNFPGAKQQCDEFNASLTQEKIYRKKELDLKFQIYTLPAAYEGEEAWLSPIWMYNIEDFRSSKPSSLVNFKTFEYAYHVIQETIKSLNLSQSDFSPIDRSSLSHNIRFLNYRKSYISNFSDYFNKPNEYTQPIENIRILQKEIKDRIQIGLLGASKKAPISKVMNELQITALMNKLSGVRSEISKLDVMKKSQNDKLGVIKKVNDVLGELQLVVDDLLKEKFEKENS